MDELRIVELKNETARRLDFERKIWAGEGQVLFPVKGSCKKKLAAVSKAVIVRQ